MLQLQYRLINQGSMCREDPTAMGGLGSRAEKTPGPEVQTVHCRWLEVWVPCRQHDERNEQREQTTEEHAVVPGAARGSGRVPCGRVR